MNPNHHLTDLTSKFYAHLTQEVTQNGTQLADEHYRTTASYYKRLRQNPSLRPFYQYNWTRRVMPLLHSLATLPIKGEPWHLLDAGCGVGTESLLSAMIRPDLHVYGVDMQPQRLAAASARVSPYRQMASHPLSVKFTHGDIFETLASQPFDIIWTMEAISHIDPAETFILKAYESLSPNGLLIISDSHALNPAMMWRLWKLRRQGVPERSQRALTEGKMISYAEERLFSVRQLSNLLRQARLTVKEIQLSIFFPPFFARHSMLFKLGTTSDTLLNRVPILRHLGGIYTIVAQKTG